MISLDLTNDPMETGWGSHLPEAISTETLPTSRSLRGSYLGNASSDWGKIIQPLSWDPFGREKLDANGMGLEGFLNSAFFGVGNI